MQKREKYKKLMVQLSALLEGETDLIANMANTAGLLREEFGFFWVGFYRCLEGELVLGPFQGPIACVRIAEGKGVCGKSAIEKKIIIVPNVHDFDGHIACNPNSKSEIVVPFVFESKCQFVLDVDQNEYNDFDETDAIFLEKVVKMVGTASFSIMQSALI